MVPWQVGFIPNFITVFKLGWLNTYTAFIIPAIPNAFSVFFLRQYMQTLPDELLDAARIDGANEWRIWLQIILPQVGPALAALTIYSVLNEWNNFVWPLIVAQTPNMQTLPVALSTLNSVASGPRNMGVFMVASLLTSIPAVTIFLAFQRQFIQSIARSGIKG
jgi:multiple sugar transport system permease protein